MQVVKIIIVTPFLLIVYGILKAIIRQHSYENGMRQRGCKRAPRIANKLPFAIDFFLDAAKADTEKKFPEMMVQRFERMGDTRTFEHFTLGTHGLSTNDPKNLQAIHATQFKDFGLGDRRNGIFRPLLGKGIFAVDGEAWSHSRALLRPQFTRDQVTDLALEEHHVKNMMRALPTDKSGWTTPTDLQPLFFRLTLDSACEFLFGESVNSQIINLPENIGGQKVKASHKAIDEVNFATAFDRAQGWLSDRTRLMGMYWADDGPGRRRDTRTVHEFVEYFVRRAIERRANSPADKTAGEQEKYVFLDALAADTQDPIELRDQLCNILLAGRDSTASLLGWTFWLLVRNPRVFQKLRDTVVAEFGPYSADDVSNISFTTLKGCAYLQRTLHETLRLFPVVPINMRQALRDTSLPVGGGEDGKSPVFVAKGQIIDYSVHALHRTEAFWGPDADEFRPERWESRKIGWDYLPFSGGPRICLGQQFALTEASYVIVRLLQRFDAIENLDTDTEPTHNLTLVNNPFKGVQVRLHEAAN
ncbi:cytochrome P450 [Xylaria palmicola]|nr:cytochrome P450 [Xylaria palmicola]